MKKEIISKFSLILVSIILSVGMAGCADNSAKPAMGTEDSVNAQYQADSAATESDNSPEAALDIAQTADNIVLNGESIKLPTSLKELGEDYDLGEKKDIEDKYNEYTFDWYDLKYKSNVIGEVMVMNDAGKIEEDLTISGIKASNDFSVDNIHIGGKVDDVFKKWGEPSDKLELSRYRNAYKYNQYCDHIFVYTEKEDKSKIEELTIVYLSFLDDN